MLGFLKEAGGNWITGLKRKRCDQAGCSRWLTEGSYKACPVGVVFGTCWYCSYKCFYTAALEQFTALPAGQPRYASSKPSKSLGLELVGRGLLTPQQLRFISDLRPSGDQDAGDLFVEHGFVTEAQVTAARAALWGCPVYSPSAAIIHCGIQIPSVLAAGSLALPMHYVSGTRQLLLGFLYAVDYELMFAIENMTGCTAKACFVKPSDFYLHQAQTYLQESQSTAVPTEKSFDITGSAEERARILSNHGKSVNANQVKITLCRNYLWARLQGTSGISDLLFKLD